MQLKTSKAASKARSKKAPVAVVTEPAGNGGRKRKNTDWGGAGLFSTEASNPVITTVVVKLEAIKAVETMETQGPLDAVPMSTLPTQIKSTQDCNTGKLYNVKHRRTLTVLTHRA